jgi:signal transduction histidine kinase
LNQALAFKNKVFSIIAHDLKSPVASLVQNSALLDLDLDKAEQNKVIQSFKEMSRGALNLIENLLYWGRSQGNQVRYQPEVIDVKKLLEKITSLFAEMARQKSIALHCHAENGSEIFADRELLEIILRNLISNAIKFTPAEGSILVKALEPAPQEELLEIQIEDNGVGMDEETMRKLMESKEMHSSPGTGNEKGTGLGLKLCQELVQVNKGQMKIESEPDKGTRVRLRLPLKATEIS